LKAKTPKAGKPKEKIYATFWHQGTFLAKVSRELTVVPVAEPNAAATRSYKPSAEGRETSAALETEAPAAVAPPRPVSSVQTATIGPNAMQADLTVYVIENTDPSKPHPSEIIIASPHLQPSIHQYASPAGTDEWLEFHYAKFVKQVLDLHKARNAGADGEELEKVQRRAMALLRGFGLDLYERFAPQPFKDAFWKLADRLGPRFRTIQIYSNNPVIPWELMRPRRPDGSEERNFLGMDFTIGRWHVSHGANQLDRPPQSLPVRELVVVAPGYGEGQALIGQKAELDALGSVRGFRRMPGRLETIEDLFRALPQGIVHFAGHGSARPSPEGPYEYYIGLEDGDLDLTMLRGLVRPNDTMRHPFFFFNACEVGQAHRVADFVGGWGPVVLESGASGFIGALWPVDDRGAVEFAAYFYQVLEQRLQSGPVAAADLLRETRRLFLEKGNPTFLAFVFYGDPNLRFVRE
jgi:hypothetical protein